MDNLIHINDNFCIQPVNCKMFIRKTGKYILKHTIRTQISAIWPVDKDPGDEKK